MAGFQFARSETYSRKRRDSARQRDRQRTGNTQGARKRQQRIGVSELAEELMREPQATPHVPQPMQPRILEGMDPRDIDPVLEERRQERRQALRRTGIKPPRQDTHQLEGAVASFPTKMRDMDDEAWAAYRAWRDDAVAHLKEDMRQRGVEPLSVVEHVDEGHPHVHVLGTPTPEGSVRLDARETHPGHAAAKAAGAEGAGNSYRQALHDWQDAFHDAVSAEHGQARYGPQRFRETRAQWRARQADKEASARAQQRSQQIIEEAQERAQRIEAMAQAMADAQLAEADAAASMADDALVAAQKSRDVAERQEAVAAQMRAEAAADRQAAHVECGNAAVVRLAAENARRIAARERVDAEADRAAAADQRQLADADARTAENAWSDAEKLRDRASQRAHEADRERQAAVADRQAAAKERQEADRILRRAQRREARAQADREQAKSELHGAQADRTDAAHERRQAAGDRDAASFERRKAEAATARAQALEAGVQGWMDGRIRGARTDSAGHKIIDYRNEQDEAELAPIIRPAFDRVWRWIRDTAEVLRRKLDNIMHREAAVARREQDVVQREHAVAARGADITQPEDAVAVAEEYADHAAEQASEEPD